MDYSCKNKDDYIGKMNALKELVKGYNNTRNSLFYRIGLRVTNILYILRKDKTPWLRKIKYILNNYLDYFHVVFKIKSHRSRNINLTPANYFNNQRIAVYTCVFGNYDVIPEPVTRPNNIDYFFISDIPAKKESCWKKVDIECYKELIKDFSNVEKNRWFKMHPFDVFPNYKYTIYIDGNIKPITDFTEFINRIGYAGIAMYNHRINCVYIEALLNHYMIKKISNIELANHIKYLREKGMPENFGMTTCNVIARDRDNKICRKLMDDWWNEFMSHCKRDQISFPFVVWKNKLQMSDVALLGDDVWNSDTLLVTDHKNRRQ